MIHIVLKENKILSERVGISETKTAVKILFPKIVAGMEAYLQKNKEIEPKKRKEEYFGKRIGQRQFWISYDSKEGIGSGARHNPAHTINRAEDENTTGEIEIFIKVFDSNFDKNGKLFPEKIKELFSSVYKKIFHELVHANQDERPNSEYSKKSSFHSNEEANKKTQENYENFIEKLSKRINVATQNLKDSIFEINHFEHRIKYLLEPKEIQAHVKEISLKKTKNIPNEFYRFLVDTYYQHFGSVLINYYKEKNIQKSKEEISNFLYNIFVSIVEIWMETYRFFFNQNRPNNKTGTVTN